jgi:hypothetical protein
MPLSYIALVPQASEYSLNPETPGRGSRDDLLSI